MYCLRLHYVLSYVNYATAFITDKYSSAKKCDCMLAVDGGVAKWSECLTDVQNIDGSSRTLGS